VRGGLVSGTVLGVVFTPVFFVVVRRVFTRRSRAAEVAEPEAAAPGASAV
jgi:hypothetical protein